MISKQFRFHGHGSLKYTYRNGRTVRGPLISIRYVPNNRREHYRLAVVVSKKVSKSAVVRNRIRRRLYEAFRLALKDVAQPHDMVVTVFHEQVAVMPHDELARMVHAQLKQAEITTAT